MEIEIRQISMQDWLSVMKIQSEAYVDVQPESEDVLQSKAEFSPETCFVAESQNIHIAGYCLAHPWEKCSCPHLYEISVPTTICDNIFIHDLSVSSKFRSKKVAYTLFNKLYEICKNKNYKTMTLVSVQNSKIFWERLGFSVDHAVNVSSQYGENAIFMCRHV